MNAYKVVEIFEQEMASYAGSRYAVAVDSGSAALFLAIKYEQDKLDPNHTPQVSVPRRTFDSVPAAVINAGCTVEWVDLPWTGWYQLTPLPVIDSACRLRKGMCRDSCMRGMHVCLSFQLRKPLPIGRGGMILTDSKDAAYWFRAMRWFGRSPQTGRPVCCGWNFKMEPERAAKGLELMRDLDPKAPDLKFDYLDLSQYECYVSEP